jgi:hypothetical protein
VACSGARLCCHRSVVRAIAFLVSYGRGVRFERRDAFRGGILTPARRAFERPIAMACCVDRAPCFPARVWSISSRTNSPAWVEGDLPSRRSRRTRSIVARSGIFTSGAVPPVSTSRGRRKSRGFAHLPTGDGSPRWSCERGRRSPFPAGLDNQFTQEEVHRRSMIPTHPCPTCGHATEVECARAAKAVRAEQGVQCAFCQHACLHRAVQDPSLPGATAQPGVSSTESLTPPTPLEPQPDLGPPSTPFDPTQP